jgi:hypothetical protein
MTRRVTWLRRCATTSTLPAMGFRSYSAPTLLQMLRPPTLRRTERMVHGPEMATKVVRRARPWAQQIKLMSMRGGFTADTFRATVDGEELVVKLPGLGKARLPGARNCAASLGRRRMALRTRWNTSTDTLARSCCVGSTARRCAPSIR